MKNIQRLHIINVLLWTFVIPLSANELTIHVDYHTESNIISKWSIFLEKLAKTEGQYGFVQKNWEDAEERHLRGPGVANFKAEPGMYRYNIRLPSGAVYRSEPFDVKDGKKMDLKHSFPTLKISASTPNPDFSGRLWLSGDKMKREGDLVLRKWARIGHEYRAMGVRVSSYQYDAKRPLYIPLPSGEYSFTTRSESLDFEKRQFYNNYASDKFKLNDGELKEFNIEYGAIAVATFGAGSENNGARCFLYEDRDPTTDGFEFIGSTGVPENGPKLIDVFPSKYIIKVRPGSARYSAHRNRTVTVKPGEIVDLSYFNSVIQVIMLDKDGRLAPKGGSLMRGPDGRAYVRKAGTNGEFEFNSFTYNPISKGSYAFDVVPGTYSVVGHYRGKTTTHSDEFELSGADGMRVIFDVDNGTHKLEPFYSPISKEQLLKMFSNWQIERDRNFVQSLKSIAKSERFSKEKLSEEALDALLDSASSSKGDDAKRVQRAAIKYLFSNDKEAAESFLEEIKSAMSDK